MVLRRIVGALINNAQLVERLAESRPVRRAAQITAAVVIRAQLAGKDAADRVLRSDTLRQVRREAAAGGSRPRGAGELSRTAGRIKDTFLRELKEGMRDATRSIKDKK